MICRYCGNAYATDDRTCQGCGAPKTGIVSKVLDAPSTPDHWSNSFRQTVLRVFIVTIAVLVMVLLLGLVGWVNFGAVLAFFWAMPVAPSLLAYGAWRTAKGDLVMLFTLLTAAAMVWGGVFLTTMLIIGVGVTAFVG